ncbi:MAG: hypothetical protein KDD66_08625 [Bdellovibrionales bacterium]|nr:hypothetical protein [Bdellovibrionales bacterium]
MNKTADGQTLVQINRPSQRCPASWHERAANGPMVDKFFALGALFGVVGTLGYGLYLWLVFNNLLPLVGSYPELRRVHALVQIFLFFGLFVLGFVSQAGGKMLGADLRFAKIPLVLLPVYVLGGIAMLFGQFWGACIVSASFSCYAIRICHVCIGGCEHPLQAVLTVLGLSILAISPFLSLENPTSALIVMWGGYGTLLFAASGQFIDSFLGGSTLAGRAGVLFLVLHVIGVLLLVFGSASKLKYIAVAALAVLLVYLFATSFHKWVSSFCMNPFGFAVVSGYLWATAAWAVLLVGRHASFDLTVHILATGWAATLILAISSQVIAFLTGRKYLLPRNLWWTLLAVWQLVPLGRGAFHLFGIPSWFSLVVAASSTAVMMCWATSICRAEWTMLRLQSVLQKGEALKSCG